MTARTRPGLHAAASYKNKEIKANVRGTGMNKIMDKTADKVMDKETKGNARRTEMNNVMEIVDSCIKSQKDFMDSFAKAQKDGVERWVEATL